MPKRFRIPQPPRLHHAVAYGSAVAISLLGLSLEAAVHTWVEPVPFVVFFVVVLVAAWVGGLGPGIVSALMSAACGYHFIAVYAGHPDRALVGVAVFLPVASLIAVLGALVREGFHEREATALELADAVRARDEFISTASHELKTPLASLLLVTQHLALLEARGAMDADANLLRLVRSVEQQTMRLNLLVNNLLDVSRITSGRMHLDLEDVDLVQVIGEVAERFGGELKRVGVDLTIDAPGSMVGRWDRLRLDQVVTNLISNAVKYGCRRPVAVSVRRDGSAAVLQIADQGTGIAPEDHERVFERYERGAHGSAPGGLGLGLWIVREITQVLGGTVRVDSALQQGATFTVVLPISRSETAAGTTAA